MPGKFLLLGCADARKQAWCNNHRQPPLLSGGGGVGGGGPKWMELVLTTEAGNSSGGCCVPRHNYLTVDRSARDERCSPNDRDVAFVYLSPVVFSAAPVMNFLRV